jgi:hypothetical protein
MSQYKPLVRDKARNLTEKNSNNKAEETNPNNDKKLENNGWSIKKAGRHITANRTKRWVFLVVEKKLVNMFALPYFCVLKIVFMKAFFEAIAFLFEEILFLPLEALRTLELSSWVLANVINWGFLIVGMVAGVYWVLQLKKFNDSGEEDKDPSAHSFL